jgi:hypothetical protein
MRINIILLFIVVLFAGCKIKEKKKVENITNKYNIVKTSDLITNRDFKHLSLRGKGEIKLNTGNQSFRIEIRIKENELIWIDISDPFLGLKVARGIISPEKFAFYNRLEKNYMEGDLKQLEKIAKREIPFEWLHNMIVNRPSQESAKIKISEVESILHILFQDRNVEHMLIYDPNEKKILNQSVRDEKDILMSTYKNFQNTTHGIFPFNYSIKLEGRENIELDFEWNKVNFSESNDYPFSIPKGYVQI